MRLIQMFKVEMKGINKALYISTAHFLATDLFFAVMQANNRGL